MIGLLNAQYTLTGQDASAHMSEETHNAAEAAPRGIIFDRHGVQLVQNVGSFAIAIVPFDLAKIGDARNQELARSGSKDAETPEDGGMHGPGHRVAEDLLLEDPDLDEVGHAARNVVPTRVVEPSDAQVSDEALHVVREEADGDDDDEGKQAVRCSHGVLTG